MKTIISNQDTRARAVSLKKVTIAVDGVGWHGYERGWILN